jgi:hypothetical protein
MMAERNEDELEREAAEADPVRVAFGAAVVAVIETTVEGPMRKQAVGMLLEAFANVRKLLHRGALN